MALLAVIVGALTVHSAAHAETVTYLHTDVLGSPVAATDEAGNVIWREDYNPYGDKRIQDPNATNRDVWYTGKQHNERTGLSYFGARYYDPTVGRFTGMDPVRFDGANIHTFNRYAYANNNPYKYVDPDGRLPIIVPIIVGIGLELGNLYLEARDNHNNPCNDCVRSSGAFIPGPIGGTTTKLASRGSLGLADDGLGTGLIKGVDDVVNSASRPARAGSQDSRALQALKKKIDRRDDAFSGLSKTEDTANDVIRQTLSAENPIVKTSTRNGKMQRDVFDPSTGRGVRTIDGEFDTFVNFHGKE